MWGVKAEKLRWGSPAQLTDLWGWSNEWSKNFCQASPEKAPGAAIFSERNKTWESIRFAFSAHHFFSGVNQMVVPPFHTSSADQSFLVGFNPWAKWRCSVRFFSRFRKVTCKLLSSPTFPVPCHGFLLTRSRFHPVSDPVFLPQRRWKITQTKKGPHVVATGCREGGCFAIC